MSAYDAGIVVGAAAFVILMTVLILWAKGKSVKDGCKYDERQQIIRGNGYKIGFMVLFILNLLYGLLSDICGHFPIALSSAMFIIALVGAMTNVVYCIWNDAWIALNESKGRILVLFGFLGAINLLLGTRQILNGSAFSEGEFCDLNLVCGIMFIVIFAVIFARYMVSRSEEGEE